MIPGITGHKKHIDADTGGFNLQAAFSTGWIAGRAISCSTDKSI